MLLFPLPPFGQRFRFKDGEKLSETDDRIKLEQLPDGTSRLTIENSVPEDEGLYRLFAENPGGAANTKANAIVKRTYVLVSGWRR